MSTMNEIEEKAINLYKSGLSLKNVAERLGYKSSNSIKNILIKHGIERRSTAGYKEPFNEDFFEIIDTERKAYWLGFFMADGNVAERKNSQPVIRIELQKKDRYILEELEKDFGVSNKIKNSRSCYSLRVHSRKMFHDLNKYGIIPNKTKHETMDNIFNLSEDMIRHFIRGFFDGDGWITNTTSHGKRKGSRKCIGFVSNRRMLEQLQIYLNKKIGTRINKIQDREGCSMLLYSSKRDIEAIKNFIYLNATIYLKRKFEKCYEIYVNTETAISK